MDDQVVAPYAGALALMVAPREACVNLERLARMGAVGRFGLYEAVDFTPSRLPPGEHHAIVRTFMAHHSGMSLLALDFALAGRPMQRRFLADPRFRAALLLLQERVPLAAEPTGIGAEVKPERRRRPGPCPRAGRCGPSPPPTRPSPRPICFPTDATT